MKVINSLDNPLIKKFRSLSVKKYREQFGLCLIEGEKVVREAIKIGGMVENLLISANKKDYYNSIIKEYNDLVIIVSDEIIKSLTSAVTNQGIVAVAKIREPKPISLKNNLIVLDRLQDPGNLGTIIRSSVASGYMDIVLVDSVDPYNDKTIRSASGTIFYPNFIKMKQDEFNEFVKISGINLVIADMDGESIYGDFNVNSPYAIVVGNEGQGVSDEMLSLPHQKISIPMANVVESLNAGVSASVIMFHLANANK